MVARGVGWGMGNLGKEDWEAQASGYGVSQSQGWMVQQREYGRWYWDSVVWGQIDGSYTCDKLDIMYRLAQSPHCVLETNVHCVSTIIHLKNVCMTWVIQKEESQRSPLTAPLCPRVARLMHLRVSCSEAGWLPQNHAILRRVPMS